MARDNFYVMQYLIFTFQRAKAGQGKKFPRQSSRRKRTFSFRHVVLHRQDNQLFGLDAVLASFAVLAITVQDSVQD